MFITAISSDSIWGKEEITAGIGMLENITGLVGITSTSAALVAVKCLIAGMFKRLSQFHISVKLVLALGDINNEARIGTSHPFSGIVEQPPGRLERVAPNLWDIDFALLGLGLRIELRSS